ncbi:MAG: hypothetical protein HC767_03495 [Akkermansiaceae bacterium]|nr:hypothetical protein [Akkermansiaceae bacterium]
MSLFLLGVALLAPPILIIFNRPERVLGIPVLYLYLFVIWGTLIGLAASLSRRVREEERPARDTGDAARQQSLKADGEPAADA